MASRTQNILRDSNNSTSTKHKHYFTSTKKTNTDAREAPSQNILRDFHYSRNGKTVPVETAAPLNIADQYVDAAFAGSPVDLGDEVCLPLVYEALSY